MASITPQQILVPKKVYIGDAAELRCTFNSPSTALKQLTINGTTEIYDFSDNTNISALSDDYDIKSITLSPAGVDFYQLSVNFIPWKTGLIEFPNLKLEDITIVFEPVQIVSLISTDTANTTVLHDTAAPLLLPGTAYKLYGTLLALILLAVIFIRIIIKRKSLMFYLNSKKLLRRYKKNKKHTIRALHQITAEIQRNSSEINNDNSKKAAAKIQSIMRHYLEVRFDFPFTHAASSEIMPGFYKATGGLLSEQKEEAFGNIAASFIRTDYIRYSSDAKFEKDELNSLIQNLISQIESLETIEKDKTDKTSETEHKEES